MALTGGRWVGSGEDVLLFLTLSRTASLIARLRLALALFRGPTGYRFAALVIQGFSLCSLDMYLTTLMFFRPSPHLLHSVFPHGYQRLICRN